MRCVHTVSLPPPPCRAARSLALSLSRSLALSLISFPPPYPVIPPRSCHWEIELRSVTGRWGTAFIQTDAIKCTLRAAVGDHVVVSLLGRTFGEGTVEVYRESDQIYAVALWGADSKPNGSIAYVTGDCLTLEEEKAEGSSWWSIFG